MPAPSRGHWAQRADKNLANGLKHGFRSGLEAKNAKHLEAHGQPVLFETFKLRYVIPVSVHTYTLDFRLANGILVETKGRWLLADRAKHLFVTVQYPDLDIRLVFSSAKAPINPGAKTSCGEWAEKHGIKWAEKLIPEAWLKEPGPSISPEDALKAGPIGYRDILKKEKRA